MITINTLFSGIGAQEAALKRLDIPYKVIGISEIDKFAIQSYEAINGPTRNYGDITQIPYLDYADLWTYSSPCQDFSTAGKQKGIYNADGSLTRSGLLLHVERLLTDAVIRGDNPKYLLMENVKGLVSKKFKPDFLNWLDKLEQLGYNNYWQVLNAKDYGIPQNRERVFVVSIRKDVDTKGCKFPSPVPLQKRLKDVLEPFVDHNYYLSEDKVEKLTLQIKEKEVSNTIRCGGGGSLDGEHTWDIVVELMVYDEQNGYVRKDGCVGTLTTDGSSPKHNNRVIEPLCVASRGRNPENPSDRTAGIPTEQMFEINYSGCTNTLTSVQKDNYIVEPKITDGYRIRKLTPRECWRLMGFNDVEFECAQLSGVSNSQLYKQAGNSIVVDVLVAIFKELFNDRS